MPANKYALLRYRIIDRCLSNKSRPYPSKEDLRQACEDTLYGSDGENISISTIEKDMWAMRNESELGYYAPIKYHQGERGYYYEDEDYTIQDISLNDEDMSAINFAAMTLYQFKDIPVFDQFGHAIEKILDRLNFAPGGDHKAVQQYVQFENNPPAKGSDYLGALLESIKQTHCIELEYQKFTADSSSTYLLHPYLLKEYRGRWYLIAFDPKKNDYRTFGLERIVKINHLNERFELKADFNPDRFFSHSIGITEADTAPQDIILRCHDQLKHYLISQPIHHSQVQLEQDGDFKIHVLITYELINIILGFGHQLEVVSPNSLRKIIASRLKSALSNYE